jgi:Class II histone deacetylase complex subunits 2 and 3
MRKNVTAEQAEARAKAQRLAEQRVSKSAFDPSKPTLLESAGKPKLNSDNESPTSSPYDAEDRDLRSPNLGDSEAFGDVNLHNPEQPLDVQLEESEHSSSILHSEPIQHAMEFTVPVPLSGITLSQYRKILAEEYKGLEPLVKKKQVSEEMVTKGEQFLWRLRNLCINYDLDTRQTIDKGTTPDMMAAWYPSASPKFCLFGKILDQLRERDMHILVLAKKLLPKPGADSTGNQNIILDMLETFVIGNNITCARPSLDRMRLSTNAESRLKITVSLSTADETLALTGPFDMILSFDPDLDTSRPGIDALRRSSFSGHLVPVIFLILQDTIDHVEQVMSPIQTGIDRLQVEVLCVTTLKIRPPPDFKDDSKPHPLEEYALLIDDFISQNYAPEAWSIPSLGPLNDHESYDLVLGDRFADQIIERAKSGTKSPKIESAGKSAKSASPKKANGKKRSRDSTSDAAADSFDHVEKKPRVVEDEESGQDMDMADAAQILVAKLETVAAEAASDVPAVPELDRSDSERMVTDEPESVPVEPPSQSTRIANIALIRKSDAAEKAKYEARIEDLETTIHQQRETIRIRDRNYAIFTRDMDDQCNRYEEQRREMDELRREFESAKNHIELLTKRRARQDEQSDALKTEVRGLKDELRDARSKLATNEIPAVSEFEALRAQLEDAVNAKERTRRSMANNEQTLEFVRAQYQDVGEKFLDASRENETLKERLEILERKASGEQHRLQELALRDAKELQQTEHAILQARYENALTVISRLEEEKRTKRPGVYTRAGSVPRSPRVGPSSRAPSPIPDRRIENLKSGAAPNYRPGKTSASTPAEKPAPARKGKAAAAAQQLEKLEKPDEREKPARGAQANAPATKEPAKVSSPKQPGAEGKADAKLPDLQPAHPTQARPAIEIKTGPPTSRPFPCCFMQYNCPASFTSKNEWKRHISTKHIQLGFWRCDMCPPNTGGERPSYNDFNRKDLFTQHLRRMHTQQQMMGILDAPPPQNGSASNLTEEQIQEIVKRCYKILRLPPPQSNCLFCARTFQGPTSWEERLEHVGGHLERDRKNGQNCLDLASWREDPVLRDWLVAEGIIEQDARGGWRIGDGRPRNRGPAASADLPSANAMSGTAPATPSTPTGGHSGLFATTPNGEEIQLTPIEGMGSMSRRRRGRPPKRYSELDGPMKLQPNVSPHGADSRSVPGLQPLSPAISHSSPGPAPMSAGLDSMAMQIDSMGGMAMGVTGTPGRRPPPPLLPQPQPRPETSSPMSTPSGPGYGMGALPPLPQYPPLSMAPGGSLSTGASLPPPMLPQILPRAPPPHMPGTPQNRNIAPVPQSTGSPLASPYMSQHGHGGPVSIAPAGSPSSGPGPRLSPAMAPSQLPGPMSSMAPHSHGPGPLLAPAPAPLPLSGIMSGPPAQSPPLASSEPLHYMQAPLHPQEAYGEHQSHESHANAGYAAQMANAAAGVPDDGEAKARGRSFREVIM